MSEPRLNEVARDVYVLAQPVLSVNATLIVGGHGALVVDTLSTTRQASQLRAEVRRITRLPVQIVNTHVHFDHWFGNAAVAEPDTKIWAYDSVVALMAGRTTEVAGYYREGDPDFADDLEATELRPATEPVHHKHSFDLGDRDVDLYHFGRGHTDGDLVLHVPDADALLAGDLIEQGAPPGFGDGFPLDWPDTVAALKALLTRYSTVIPGHGAVVDRAYVTMQHDDLAQLAWLIRDGHADGAPAAAVAARAPFDMSIALVAVERGYAELSGKLDR